MVIWHLAAQCAALGAQGLALLMQWRQRQFRGSAVLPQPFALLLAGPEEVPQLLHVLTGKRFFGSDLRTIGKRLGTNGKLFGLGTKTAKREAHHVALM